nr:MAG TPA: helix-turn-helix protein [Caudoviricetes sp.]
MAKRKITDTDKQIIEMKAQGFMDKEIAESLNIEYSTYRYRYNRLLIKMDALNAPNLVYTAFQKGILKI